MWSTGRWRRAPCSIRWRWLCLRRGRAGRRVALPPARRRAGGRDRRRRSGAAGGCGAGAADARAGKRSAARGDDRLHRYRRRLSARGGGLAPAGRRLDAQRACRSRHGERRRARPSGARRSGCRICGPGARAAEFALPPSSSRFGAGDVDRPDGQRPAAADRIAGRDRHRKPRGQGALDRSATCSIFRWRRAACARRPCRRRSGRRMRWCSICRR